MFYFILFFLLSFPTFSSDSDPCSTIERRPTWAFKLERQVVETDGIPTQQQLIIYGTVHDYPIDMIPLRALEVIKICDALYGEKSDEEESSENICHMLKEREIISLTKYQDFYMKLSNEAQEALAYLNSIRTEEEDGIEDLRTIHPGFLYSLYTRRKNEFFYQNGMDFTLDILFKEQEKHIGGLEKSTDCQFIFAINEIFSHPFYNLENVPLIAESEKILISKAQSKKNEGTRESDYFDDSSSRDPLWKEAYDKVDMSFFFKDIGSFTLQRNINWIEPTIALAAKHKLACILVGTSHLSDSAENPEAKSYLKLLQENGFSISQMYTDGTFEDYLL